MNKLFGTPSQTEQVAEMIGRNSAFTFTGDLWPHRPTVDRTRSDYRFWSLLRRGKADGYRLGALFAPAIGQIMTSWTIGGGFEVRAGEDDYTNGKLKDFIDNHQEFFQDCAYDGYTLGDGALAVNPDGSLTAISPDQLSIETNRFNWRQVESYTLTSIIDEPVNFVRDLMKQDFQSRLVGGGGMVTILDQYTPFSRVITIKDGSAAPQTQTFDNPIGRLPITHFAQGREANEVTGHPVYEHLLYLFARYDNVINKALDGVEVMGNPLLAFLGIADPEKAKRDNATSYKTVRDAAGNVREEPQVDLSEVQAVWLGDTARVEFIAPGAFTQDTARMLELLFYLMLQSCMIPEHVWGGAIASSNASVDAQLPSFVRAVEGWRLRSRKWLLETCEIWRAWQSLSDQKINISEPLKIEFPEVVPEDAKILLEKMALARREGAIDRSLLVRKLDITDDPEQAIEDADEEAEEKRQQFEDAMDARIEREAGRPEADEDEDGEDQMPMNGNGRRVAAAV